MYYKLKTSSYTVKSITFAFDNKNILTDTYKQVNMCITNALIDKKAEEIFEFDLTGFDGAACQHFFVCHGNSNTQVGAIANNVEKEVKEKLSIQVYNREGLNHCHWVLLDFGSVMVHIFQKEYRDYYKLEELWADATIEKVTGGLKH